MTSQSGGGSGVPVGSAGGILGGTYPNPVFATNGTTSILGTASAVLGASVNITSINTATDILSLALTQGTWLIIAKALATNGAGVANITGKLWDGTTVLSSDEITSPAGTNSSPLNFCGVYVSAGAATVKITAYSNDTLSHISATAPQNGQGATATYILALRIA